MLTFTLFTPSLNARPAVLTSAASRASAPHMMAWKSDTSIGSALRLSRDTLGIGQVPSNLIGNVVPTSIGKELTPASVAAPAAVTEAEVLECQAKWANAIASISSVYLEEGDFVAAAGEAAGELYGYGHHNVLFKPTKATKHPFRATGAEAMSYFVGAEAMKNDEFKGEDAGFAINGGKGWSKVVFTNHQIDLNGETATAMGSYDFTCATTGDVATVEYTFGYKRCADGKPRIYLHHSSVPYSA
mmetsp:Transcript_47189/g.156416  ORF Transcript_47189/g.156416 Transcript_47189/m.156416 type:complete len:244 (+) Transcript_47189:52-783(+)